MLFTPFYDPEKTYEENFEQGPFGAFSDGEVLENSGESRYDFLGLKVNSLFGIPAGPLINGKFVQSAFYKGFDICVYKTVRSYQYPCHQWPNVLSVKVEGDLKIDQRLVVNHNYTEPLSITKRILAKRFESFSKKYESWANSRR
jgi:hypothetical protein